MAIALVSAGTIVEALTPAFGQPTTAGNLLVAWVAANDGSASFPITVTGTGWTLAVSGGAPFGWMSVWYRANCGASETAPVFHAGGSDWWTQLAEYSGAATASPFDQGAAAGPSNIIELYWNAAFTALDTTQGELVAAGGYWNGPTAGNVVNVNQFNANDGTQMASHLAQSANGSGQSFATAWGLAGQTGSFPHAVAMQATTGNGASGVMASFKAASPGSTALAVQTGSLPAGMTTFAYPVQQIAGTLPDMVGVVDSTLRATGGQPPYTWSVISGALPGGVTLASAGLLSGTCAAAGVFPVTFQVTDNLSATATAALPITVTAAPAVQQTVIYSGSGHSNFSDPNDPEWQSFPIVTDPQGRTSNVPNVDQNVWNPNAGYAQETDVYSLHMWEIKPNCLDAGGAVHSFPSTGVFTYRNWKDWRVFISGWDTWMDTQTDIICSGCYDFFVDQSTAPHGPVSNVNEIMFHFDFRNRGYGPWYATKVPFGGYTVNGRAIPATLWNLAYTPGNLGAFFNLVDATGHITSLPVGAIDIRAGFQWCEDNGIIAPGTELTIMGAGFEVCTTNSATRIFRYNDLWMQADLAPTYAPGPPVARRQRRSVAAGSGFAAGARAS